MFREMRRKKQQLTTEECVEILKQEPRGILSMLGDDGYPYGIPMTHWYCEENGHLYFHGAKEGHKIDAIEKCDKVSFCVHEKRGGLRQNESAGGCRGEEKNLRESVLEVYGRSGIYKGRTSKISGSHLVPGTDPGAYDRKAGKRILKGISHKFPGFPHTTHTV